MQTTDERTEHFKLRLREYGIPEHMHGGLWRYLINGVAPGSFLLAVLENDFIGACGHADTENQRSLYNYAMLVYNVMPSDSHGSPEIVDAWIKSGGIAGRNRTAPEAAQ